MTDRVAPLLFPIDPGIRYVATNQGGAITEMEQRVESHNPPETDRMEELIVNPIVLEAVRRRGNLDLDGVRYVIIRYGKQFQAIFPISEGHVEASADAIAVSEKVAETLQRAGGPPR